MSSHGFKVRAVLRDVLWRWRFALICHAATGRVDGTIAGIERIKSPVVVAAFIAVRRPVRRGFYFLVAQSVPIP